MIQTSLFVSILQFIIVLGFLMVCHELGHFLVARFFKVEIEEFGIGIPPTNHRQEIWRSHFQPECHSFWSIRASERGK